MAEEQESATGVILPDDGKITAEWAKEQLYRVDVFSDELRNYGKGEVFFMLQTSLSGTAFEQAIKDLEYTVETAKTYISYLQKKPTLQAVKAKYYIALSLSAAALLPDGEEDALAICDVCLAKYGKLTADNLTKTLETMGIATKKMSDAAVGIEALKKKALTEWLQDEFDMSDDDILNASRLRPEGLNEFKEKMANAYDRLEGFENFYKVIAQAVHNSGDAKAMRFLSDITDASLSIEEYLTAEKAYKLLQGRKEIFEDSVYPELQFQAETAS